MEVKIASLASLARLLRRVAPGAVLSGIAMTTFVAPSASATPSYVFGGSIAALLQPPLETLEAHYASADAGVSFYMSPSGNDSNPGTYSEPFRSFAHVQDVVRTHNHNMTGDITVYLENGIYQPSEPLQFDPRDSGTNGHAVVWSAAPGENAVISGGERISGWELSDPLKRIWSAVVPPGLRTRQLYVNGMRASLASGPAPVALTRTRTGYTASSAVMANWRHPSDITFVYTGQLGLMVEPRCPVASIRGTSITMAQPCWDNSTRRHYNFIGFGTLNAPAYVENAYELLDQPGEFYLDGSAHRLYYIPRRGENMASADVEAPVLQTLVRGVGSSSAPIHDITFSNLQFSYATWLQPSTPEGFSEIQSNYTITGVRGYATEGLCHLVPRGTCPYGAWTKEPGNVEFGYDRRLSFLNDRFVHLGQPGSISITGRRMRRSPDRCLPTYPEMESKSATSTCRRLPGHLRPAASR